ncbi:MAG: hypothetical protein ACPGVU_07715 [Limisphaerales bacterium]
MPPSFNRRTAPKVKDGKVQWKNRHRPTVHNGFVLDRESPRRGYRHVFSKQDLRDFIEIIPNWSRYSERLERIVLARNDDENDGLYDFYHREKTGAIFLHAWREDLWVEFNPDYFDDHQSIMETLGVAFDRGSDVVNCRLTEAQARAFMLLHVFMHELGHHYDRISQKNGGTCRGEDYAERFANSRFNELFPAYVRVFGHPKGVA